MYEPPEFVSIKNKNPSSHTHTHIYICMFTHIHTHTRVTRRIIGNGSFNQAVDMKDERDYTSSGYAVNTSPQLLMPWVGDSETMMIVIDADMLHTGFHKQYKSGGYLHVYARVEISVCQTFVYVPCI